MGINNKYNQQQRILASKLWKITTKQNKYRTRWIELDIKKTALIYAIENNKTTRSVGYE
jgi:hypothetical protein